MEGSPENKQKMADERFLDQKRPTAKCASPQLRNFRFQAGKHGAWGKNCEFEPTFLSELEGKILKDREVTAVYSASPVRNVSRLHIRLQFNKTLSFPATPSLAAPPAIKSASSFHSASSFGKVLGIVETSSINS
jgi:hypothetical protein